MNDLIDINMKTQEGSSELKSYIANAPPLLLIFIDRKTPQRKNLYYCEIPCYLNIMHNMLNTCANGNYELVSMILHKGMGNLSSHYVYARRCKDIDNTWAIYNDEYIYLEFCSLSEFSGDNDLEYNYTAGNENIKYTADILLYKKCE